MARRLVQLMHAADTVAVALVDLQPGTVVELPGSTSGRAGVVTVQQAVPFGHKVAIRPIGRGEPVLKYGEVIGLASADIAAGQHVHTHNVESQRGRGDLAEAHR